MTYQPSTEWAGVPWTGATETPGSQPSYGHKPLQEIRPRRIPFVWWTIRVAQLADRMAAWTGMTGHGAHKSGGRFVDQALNGFGRMGPLVPGHLETVACERSRLAITELIEQQPARHHRFQRLREASAPTTHLDDDRCPLWIYLNPARCWAVPLRESKADRQGAELSVLYFLSDGELRGVRLDLEGQALINELADYQPCTLGQWANLSSLTDRRQLATLVSRLVEIGLVALG